MRRPAIRTKDRDVILQALAAGVVPRLGLQHIQVGRAGEVGALLKDIERIADGGASVRFVIGEYGAGKTFFLNLIRLVALERKCVTIHADLGPDRRLHATGGQARGLYAQAVRNMATRSKPDGGALASVVERFVTESVREGESRSVPVERIVDERLQHLQDFVGGFDFATVVKAYWRGSETGDEILKTAALRWLRGEYSTKTEARQALGVRTIIDDAEIYDGMKLLAAFVRIAGYSGLFAVFDEMVSLYRLQSAQARKQNHDQILRIVNDVLQGGASGIGVIFGGTPEFLMDPRRGLYSNDALQSRLTENPFASAERIDFSGRVLRLRSLTPAELQVLLENVRHVFASGDPEGYLVPDEALVAFMNHCNRRIGEAYFRTPRNTVRAFVQLLSILDQNPSTRWSDLIEEVDVPTDTGAADEIAEDGGDDELASLGL